jgi:hypothetical protein
VLCFVQQITGAAVLSFMAALVMYNKQAAHQNKKGTPTLRHKFFHLNSMHTFKHTDTKKSTKKYKRVTTLI